MYNMYSLFNIEVQYFQIIMTTAVWAKSKGTVLKFIFLDGIQYLGNAFLKKLVFVFRYSLKHQPSRITIILELNPFNHLAFDTPPNCLHLKTNVTFNTPRLATRKRLVLTRRESHPLYVTT